jgi:hypothetical protein
MKPLLYAAFRRAGEVGLTVEEVETALAPAPSADPASTPPDATR